jgi:hypothetical protein
MAPAIRQESMQAVMAGLPDVSRVDAFAGGAEFRQAWPDARLELKKALRGRGT